MIRQLATLTSFLLLVIVVSCSSGDNVIQGLIKYHDVITKEDIVAEGADVYLYSSIVDRQDEPKSYKKRVTTGTSGYYSFFSLVNGPYYIYCEKLDTAGKVVYEGGTSTNVSGSETKILDLTIH